METTAFVRMRNAFEAFADSYDDLVSAIRAAWAAHGGQGAKAWQEYCETEVGEARKRIPREVRKAIVNELRKDGMSTRAVAAALGISKGQVGKDSAGAHSVGTSEGVDGKVYTRPETKPHPEDEFKTEDQPPIDEKFFAMAEAERNNELESVRAELSDARARVAELERLAALEGELNELRVSLAVIRSQARKKVGEDDMLFKLIENAMQRIISIEEKER